MAQCCKNHGELAIHWSDGAKHAKSELNFIYQLFVWIRCMCYIYIQMLCCQSGFPTCPCASFSKQSHKATLQEQNCSCASSIFQAPGCETSNGHVRLQGSNSWAATRTWRPFSWSLDLKKLMDLSELSPPWWVSCDLGQSQVTADPSAKKTCWTPSPADDPRAITCGSPQLTTWSPQQCQSLSCRDLCLSNSCDRS